MSPWKSRWSRCRLVNPTTSNSTPPTRSRARACEETSITQAPQAALTHQGEQPVQHRRLDSRARALDRLLAHPQLDGADDAGHLVHRLQGGRDEVAGGGLAVGAGDADDPRALLGDVSAWLYGHPGRELTVVGDEHRDVQA